MLRLICVFLFFMTYSNVIFSQENLLKSHGESIYMIKNYFNKNIFLSTIESYKKTVKKNHLTNSNFWISYKWSPDFKNESYNINKRDDFFYKFVDITKKYIFEIKRMAIIILASICFK
ncbi:hypothetical protein ABN224_16910 [Providencia rettgeri]